MLPNPNLTRERERESLKYFEKERNHLCTNNQILKRSAKENASQQLPQGRCEGITINRLKKSSRAEI